MTYDTNIPVELHYTETHEWITLEHGIATIGITDHAQNMLGDLVFVELPEVGRVLEAGEGCAVVESVKAASDLFSPVGGVIIEVNTLLENDPEVINEDPYGQGWVLKVKTNADTLEGLLDADAYAAIAVDEIEEE